MHHLKVLTLHEQNVNSNIIAINNHTSNFFLVLQYLWLVCAVEDPSENYCYKKSRDLLLVKRASL